MDKDTAKALMRAEAAEALLEELRNKLEVLEAENAELKAQLEGKPAPAKPEHNKIKDGVDLARAQRIMDELIIYEGFEKIDPKFSEELLRQIMETPPPWLDREIRREPERPPRHFDFRVEEHPFNGDVVVSMYYVDAGEQKVLSHAMPRGRASTTYMAEEAAHKLLGALAKEKKLDAPPKGVFVQTVREIARAMGKVRGRKW